MDDESLEVVAAVDGHEEEACVEEAASEQIPLEAVEESEGVGPWVEPCGAGPLVAWEEPLGEASLAPFLSKR